MKKIFLILIIVSLLSILPLKGETKSILIKNGTIVPVKGKILKKGEILIKNGKIAEIGEKITAPADAQVVDAAGMFIYPGFIDAFTHYGLTEIGSIPSTADYKEIGKEKPELRTAWAINPNSVHLHTGRLCGTTTALVVPAGGFFPGISALIKMDGWSLPEMIVDETAASLINFPMAPRPTRDSRMESQKASKVDVTDKIVEKIKNYLKEARFYLKKKKIAIKNKLTPPPYDAKYEALAPVLAGKMAVIISVEKAKDIKKAIKFALEEKIKVIFRGCSQGFKVAKSIKNAKIPVIIDNLYQFPTEVEDGYDAPFTNVVALVKAGVKICFSSGTDPSAGKDLPYHAARAVAFGLDRDEAIKALTLNPAEILGQGKRLGSLEKGKDADLFIINGDPLDVRSQIKLMFINGKKVDLADNWWDQLYNKWKTRPKN